jgi:hypothetical protein
MDDAPSPFAQTEEQARRLQKAYARKRRIWAEAVGRPYVGKPDPRPPPGELDAEADE